jgi:hypothetical protein
VDFTSRGVGRNDCSYGRAHRCPVGAGSDVGVYRYVSGHVAGCSEICTEGRMWWLIGGLAWVVLMLGFLWFNARFWKLQGDKYDELFKEKRHGKRD